MPKQSEIGNKNSSYPVYCPAGNIEMLPTESFLIPLEKRGLSKHIVDNEVSELAGLTFMRFC